MITYSLDSSSLIHEALKVEERAEYMYHSKHKDGYTPCRHIHKDKCANLLSGFIKLDPRSNACGTKDTVPQ